MRLTKRNIVYFALPSNPFQFMLFLLVFFLFSHSYSQVSLPSIHWIISQVRFIKTSWGHCLEDTHLNATVVKNLSRWNVEIGMFLNWPFFKVHVSKMSRLIHSQTCQNTAQIYKFYRKCTHCKSCRSFHCLFHIVVYLMNIDEQPPSAVNLNTELFDYLQQPVS